jgi:prepilin-type N-terminal cleavage/methylation domain-containing protein
MMMRRRAGFTLIELIVAIAIVMVLGAVAYASYVGFEAKSRDNAAIGLADQLAANLQHYAALNNGQYPSRTSACWVPIMSDLSAAGLAELPLTPPAIFTLNAEDTNGCGILVYTSNAAGTFQIQFKATGGTGQAYCRDPNGLAAIAWQNADGPWTGCP